MGETTEGAPARGSLEETSPLVNFAFFFLAVVLACMGGGRLVPAPDYFREKLALFTRDKDEFDLIFLGASDTHWGIAPTVFDKRLAERGATLRSFNLGVPGMNGYEMDHLLREILEMNPQRLRYVVIAWRPWRLEIEENIGRREIWWHSFAETLVLFRGLWLDPIPAGEKLKFARLHGKLALQKLFLLGEGSGIIRCWLDPPGPGEGKWDFLAGTRGFEGLSQQDAERFWPEGPIEREMFLSSLPAYHERNREQAAMLKEFQDRDREAVPDYLATLYPRTVYSTQLQIERLRQEGIEPLYLIPPSHAHDRIQRRLAVEGYLSTLLDFNDPNRYPELFEVELRYDDEHFTEAGARVYSRRVADRVAEALLK